MNYKDFVIPAIIVVYAVFEYQRRESRHRERMELLKRDIEPPLLQPIPSLARILTIAATSVLLIVISWLFINLWFKGNVHGLIAVFFPAAFFTLLIFLILILRRDIKLYRAIHKS